MCAGMKNRCRRSAANNKNAPNPSAYALGYKDAAAPRLSSSPRRPQARIEPGGFLEAAKAAKDLGGGEVGTPGM